MDVSLTDELSELQSLRNPGQMVRQAASMALLAWAADQHERGRLDFYSADRCRNFDFNTVLSDAFRVTVLDSLVVGIPSRMWAWFRYMPWDQAVIHTQRHRIYLRSRMTSGWRNIVSLGARSELLRALCERATVDPHHLALACVGDDCDSEELIRVPVLSVNSDRELREALAKEVCDG